MFELDERLAGDTVRVGTFPLSLLLLSRDANYPWFILVPQRAGVREIHQLAESDQYQLLRESSNLAQTLTSVFRPDKINIAALGNVVPQLHIHHIVRYLTDPAWPRPIWGVIASAHYAASAQASVIDRVLSALAGREFNPA
ncbi:MAG: HIT domain-containing protein [Porticoccaceae bacterium]